MGMEEKKRGARPIGGLVPLFSLRRRCRPCFGLAPHPPNFTYMAILEEFSQIYQ